jgi:hypothetical protein
LSYREPVIELLGHCLLENNDPKHHSREIDYADFPRIIPLRKDLMSIQGLWRLRLTEL